jgi:hypothetical protein
VGGPDAGAAVLARTLSRLTYANVMATIAVFLALGGGALAATSLIGSDGRIRGCVSRTGNLTVLKAGKKCGKRATAIGWTSEARPGGGAQRESKA